MPQLTNAFKHKFCLIKSQRTQTSKHHSNSEYTVSFSLFEASCYIAVQKYFICAYNFFTGIFLSLFF